MIMHLRHPTLAQLAAFAAGESPPSRRGRVAAHLRNCVRCQDALRFIRRVDDLRQQPLPTPGAELLDRAIASRAAGHRTILPDGSLVGIRHHPRRIAGALAAAGLLLAAALVIARPPELAAVTEQSALEFHPAHPRPGARITVEYHPAVGIFRGADSLILRARLRTPVDPMYSAGVPVRRLAVLHRVGDERYEASFQLPDSAVFGAFAVEDGAASRVDDRDGRPWELLAYATDDRPTADALGQRVNDMMGRNWEAGYATARRLAALYPDHVSGWMLREFFERALYGDSAADSLLLAYRPRLKAVVAAARKAPHLSYGDIGSLYFRAFVTARSPRATAADSAELDYWGRRIQQDYPRHEQIAQRVGLEMSRSHSPRAALDSLERAYQQLVPIRGPGGNLLYAALDQAHALGDQAAERQWTERQWIGVPDSARLTALALASLPAYRREALPKLRGLLGAPPAALLPIRALSDDANAYALRVADRRRRVLVALGRTLIADGQTAAGLDTLDHAAHDVWDAALFHDAELAYAAAGDTAAEFAMRARLAVDPRTPPARADSMTVAGRSRLGATTWDSATAAARGEMQRWYLGRSTPRALRTVPRVTDAAGVVHTLRDLTGEKPAVVIFWSRSCGFAIEALPDIIAVGERLRRSGTPVILVVGEPPSRALHDFLSTHQNTLPIYSDVNGSATTAFANFGTPAYYVLDRAGRIRFREVDEVAELVAQVDALRGTGL